MHNDQTHFREGNRDEAQGEERGLETQTGRSLLPAQRP